jgi:hypothetical protein
MRIGVISDTHGHIANTLAAVRMLESLEVERLLHCGDICSPQIPPLLKAWPTHFVFGNCDHGEELAELRTAIRGAGLTCHERFGAFDWAGRKIALLHSDDVRLFRELITSGLYDLICYGHTHVAETHYEGKTLVLNPGALYRASPHSLAVIDLATMEATIVPL